MEIFALLHPDYISNYFEWEKYRKTFEGGKSFVNDYVIMFSGRESSTDYSNRLSISYCPAFAKAVITEIKNAIYSRFIDITRKNGSETYQTAIRGEKGGVDYNNNTMSGYIGRVILPELLSMGKVGIYVDNNVYSRPLMISEYKEKNIHPYLYKYNAEDILSWDYDINGKLTKVLLRNHSYITDEKTGLPSSNKEKYLFFYIKDNKVIVEEYDAKSVLLNTSILDIPEIPLVILEISSSLLKDVADYQIALANLASSDMWYAIKANFPFYTEQYNPGSDLSDYTRPVGDDTTEAKTAKDKETDIGIMQGRRYPKGIERPGFIHPSSEPLTVSMQKQEQIKAEIRQLVNITIMNLDMRRASAESKSFDERTLESGLSYIGLELEYAERNIAKLWGMYENQESALVNYPTNYSLKTVKDIQEEAKGYLTLSNEIPSVTYRRETLKQVAILTLGNRLTHDEQVKVLDEIDKAKVLKCNNEEIRKDHEEGLVSDATASEAIGYPQGEAALAAKDHADRAVRILNAQMSDRGVKDLSNK